MEIPLTGADGRRITVNSNLDSDGTLWNFRSAWNVAALNCLEGQHQVILDGYGAFLKKNKTALAKTNAALEQRFRKDAGSLREGSRRARPT